MFWSQKYITFLKTVFCFCIKLKPCSEWQSLALCESPLIELNEVSPGVPSQQAPAKNMEGRPAKQLNLLNFCWPTMQGH